MYIYTEKPKRDMAMPSHPLGELLTWAYHTLLAIIFYGAVIALVALVSFFVMNVILNGLFGQVSIVFIR